VFVFITELQILEAITPELRVTAVTELTMHCEGMLKSRPTWKYNDTVVQETSDTVLNQVDDRTSGKRTVVMTRHGVTEHFIGRYQCVDTAFFQSDSDILTVLPAHTLFSPSTSVAHCLLCPGRPLYIASLCARLRVVCMATVGVAVSHVDSPSDTPMKSLDVTC